MIDDIRGEKRHAKNVYEITSDHISAYLYNISKSFLSTKPSINSCKINALCLIKQRAILILWLQIDCQRGKKSF